MTKLPLFVSLLSLSLSAYAANLDNAYDQGKSMASDMRNAIKQDAAYQDFNAQNYSNKDIHHPKARHYYKHPHQMDKESAKAARNNPTAQDALHFYMNKDVNINGKSTTMQKMKYMQRHAKAISHGKSTPRYQCGKTSEDCETQKTTHTCSTHHTESFRCKEMPVVSFKEKTITNKKNLSAVPHIQPTSRYDETTTIDVPDNTVAITHINVGIVGSYVGEINCHSHFKFYINGKYIADYWTGGCKPWQRGRACKICGTHIISNKTVKVPNPDHVTLKMSGGGHFPRSDGPRPQMGGTITVKTSHQVKKPVVNWKNNCSLDLSGCQRTQHNCTQDGGTKTFSGHKVHLDCWEYTNRYQCGTAQSTHQGNNGLQGSPDNCQPYKNQCDLIGVRCTQKTGDFCAIQQRKYECIEKHCHKQKIVCGRKGFCMDGNCDQDFHKHPEADPEKFAKTSTELATAAQAGKDAGQFDKKKNVKVFGGEQSSCSINPQHAYNCCKEDAFILHKCSAKEKKLAKARQKDLAVKVGTFCFRQVMGVCVSKHEGWCVFDSELSKIVQKQGRLGQLNISMGSPKHPNCRGLTPQELQNINFNKIDFSAYYDRLKSNTDFPDAEKLKQKIKHKIHNQQASQEKSS